MSVCKEKGMGKQISKSEYYEIMRKIDEAGSDIRKLRIIKELIEEYNDDSPEVKELVRKIRR